MCFLLKTFHALLLLYLHCSFNLRLEGKIDIKRVDMPGGTGGVLVYPKEELVSKFPTQKDTRLNLSISINSIKQTPLMHDFASIS